MKSEEDKKLIEEASSCANCKQWLHRCCAECCKTVLLNINPVALKNGGKYLTILPSTPLGPGDRAYYKLRDVEMIRGYLRFKKERIRIIGQKIYYIHTCSALENNLCKLHPNGKPEICKYLTLETAQNPERNVYVTDNCLFKYKLQEVKDGKETKN